MTAMAPAQAIAQYLKEPLQKPSLHLDVSTSRSTSAFNYPITQQFTSPKSASSASSSRRSSTSDGRTEVSSAPTSATSISSAHSFGGMDPSHWLQCTFIEFGCKLQFYPQESVIWRSHCLSHLANIPPSDCICIFCNTTFRGENGWNERMSHIEQHLAQGFRIEEHSRPDFAVLRHMLKNHLIDKAQYRVLTSYHEIPGKDLGLKSMDYEPRQEPYREDVVCYDQRKEDRERKLRSSKGKGPVRESRQQRR